MLGNYPISSAAIAAQVDLARPAPRMCVSIVGATLTVVIAGHDLIPETVVGKADCS
jgi:hypothetical protein